MNVGVDHTLIVAVSINTVYFADKNAGTLAEKQMAVEINQTGKPISVFLHCAPLHSEEK